MFKTIAVVLMLAASVSTASAYDMTNKFGLGISGGYSIPVFGNAFNRAADADFGYGVHGRYHFNQSFNVDFAVTRSEFDQTAFRFDNFNFLGVYRTAGAADFTPIVGLGLGFTRIKNFTPKDLKLVALVRLGAEYGVSQWFSVGLFADYQYVSKFMGKMPSGRAHVVTPQLALTWYFGGDSSRPSRKEETSPIKKEVVAKSSFVDDSQLDSDSDGVKDPEDKCPSTPANVKVNSIGCAVDEKASMQINVEFSSGKAVLASKYDAHMKEVAAFLKKYAEVNAVIEGYTDNTGTVAKNTALSQQRANAVMDALVKNGVAKSRLTAKGYGPKDPLQDNSTAEGRQANRRVVAVLSSK